MKRKLLALVLVLFSIVGFAQVQEKKCKLDGTIVTQTPTGVYRGTATDFTATFTDESTFNLYTFLNTGTNKYVMMELFFTSWSYCPGKVPTANTIYTYYGCNMQDVRVFGFDIRDTKSSVQSFMSTNGVKYKCTYSTTANDAICQTYNPKGYYPQVYLVKSNKTFIDIGSYSVAQVKSAMTDAAPYSCVVGVPELEDLNSAVNIYPNPTEGNLTFTIENSLQGKYQIELFNIVGQNVYTEAIEKGSDIFAKLYDFSSFKKGLYLIKVTNEQGSVYKKLMIE